MEIIVGYLFGVLYFKLESPHRGDSNEYTQHTHLQDKRRKSP